MPVYKPKGSPYWHYDFTLHGVRFRRSTKAASKREAERIEERERRKILLGDGERAPILLSEAFERYYQEHARFLPSGDEDDAKMERLLRDLGDKPLSHFTDDDIAQRVARRRGETARRKKSLVSNATVNRETELLRRVFRKAQKAWKKSVAEIDWTQHLLPEPKERVREASVEEEIAIIEALRPDLRPLAEWSVITGGRWSAGARLTWPQVAGDGATRIRLKGGGEHVIPGTAALRALYAEQKGKHPIYVFPYQCQRSRGKRKKGEWYPLSKNGWRKAWKRALEAAGVSDFRWHDWRHTTGSRITRAAGIHVAQRLLGHTDIATTKRYSHVRDEDVRAAMDAMSRQDFAKEAKTGEGKG